MNWIELNSVFGLENVDRWNPIRTSAIQSRSRSIRFLGFSNHEKGAPKQEISKWPTVCSKFLRSGWSVVRSTSLAKGGTSKKRPSSHLQNVPTRSNNKMSSRTFQMVLLCYDTLQSETVDMSWEWWVPAMCGPYTGMFTKGKIIMKIREEVMFMKVL
jgi:hypothetical protein